MSIDVPHDKTPEVSQGSPPPEGPPPLSDALKAALAEKRLTLSTWDRLRSPGGVPIAAHAKPVLHMAGSFTRGGVDALKYSKHFGAKELISLLEDLRRSRGNELFESPEHEGITDNIVLRISATSSWGNSQGFVLSGGAEVTYRDTIALAGDFFGVPDTPISDGSTATIQQQNFAAAFNTLDTATASYVNGILGVINQQAADVAARAAASTASDRYSQAYTQANSGKYYDMEYNGATGGVNPYDPTTYLGVTRPLEGMYMQLANTNWDHFGHHAVAAYTAGHAVALQQAVTAHNNADQNALLRAYIIDAFACHFLSDLFATGHLRTPRKALHAWISPFPDLLAQVMHDEDNYNGMMVKSVLNPQGWLAYGDKRMADAVNATNIGYAGNALQASADEIYSTWQSGAWVLAPNYAALNHIPNLDDAWDRTNANNWKPLFVVPSPNDESQGNVDNTQIRVGPTDLRGNDWFTMNDWYVPVTFPIYAYYWELLPGGGVHSVEGAPPSVVASWAHPFQWAQSGRFDHSSTTKLINAVAVAGVIVGTPPPTFPSSDPTINDIPQTGNTDLLYVFYRQGTTIEYLTTPMANVPIFTTPCALYPNPSTWDSNGIPAVIEFNTIIRIVFPDSNGLLVTATHKATSGPDLSNSLSWNPVQYVFSLNGKQSSYPMRPTGTPALAKWGSTLYLAYRDPNDVLHYAVGDGEAQTWELPTTITVGGSSVKASSNPSLMVTGGYLVLCVGGSSSSSGNPVTIYRAPLDANGRPGSWQKYLSKLIDASNNSINVQSFAQIFQYGDSYAVVATQPSNNNIITIAPLHDNNPALSWIAGLVPNGGANAKTGTRVSVIFYQGNPYIFYVDSNASAALTAVTSALPPLHTPPGGTI